MNIWRLQAIPENIQWGHFDRSRAPRLTIQSGDIVQIETISAIGHSYPEKVMDEQVEAVYREVQDRGPGPHILTGPVAIEGAEPGDTLEVRVLALEPRHPYGFCKQIPSGLLQADIPGGPVATVFEADMRTGRARPLFRFDQPVPLPRPEEPLNVERRPVSAPTWIPLRPHLGIAGVAPEEEGRISTVPPDRHGGNLDQWRFGPGTSMYYPVFAEGALFSCGDGHLAQGDGEITGNGIESHLNALLQFIVHKDRSLHNPVLETPTSWIVHAFHPDLNEACRLAGVEAIQFLEYMGLDAHDAYTTLTLAGDFGITQVVDYNKGVHVKIRKDLFPTKDGHPAVEGSAEPTAK